MKKEVLDFIAKRFNKDCNWITGNCYYFALILHDRFPDSVIYYDTSLGHFFISILGICYDWTGEINPDFKYCIPWDRFDEYDEVQKKRIIKDCIL